MNTDTATLEVLVVTHAAICRKEFCLSWMQKKLFQITLEEKLVGACWTGEMDELLPELLRPDNLQDKLSLCNVKALRFLIWLCKSNSLISDDFHSAIDPHVFLQTQNWN